MRPWRAIKRPVCPWIWRCITDGPSGGKSTLICRLKAIWMIQSFGSVKSYSVHWVTWSPRRQPRHLPGSGAWWAKVMASMKLFQPRNFSPGRDSGPASWISWPKRWFNVLLWGLKWGGLSNQRLIVRLCRHRDRPNEKTQYVPLGARCDWNDADRFDYAGGAGVPAVRFAGYQGGSGGYQAALSQLAQSTVQVEKCAA